MKSITKRGEAFRGPGEFASPILQILFFDPADQKLLKFVKKQAKVPDNEILKAKQSRVKYFEDKERLKDTKK